MAIQEQAPIVDDLEVIALPETDFTRKPQMIGKKASAQVVQDPADYEFDGPFTD